MKARYVLGIGCALAFAAALFLDGTNARAFPFENSWHLAASGPANTNRCGAGGIYGVGSPADFGIKCGDCHIDAEAAFQVVVDEDPDFAVNGNTQYYEPGVQYNFQISIVGETHTMNPNGMPTLNGFVASFEAPDGAPVGVLVDSAGHHSDTSCPATAPSPVQGVHNHTLIYGDCHGIIYEPEPGDISWDFQWIAPPAGAGDVVLWYGATDGDNAGEDSLGDDSVHGSIPLTEATP